MMVIGRVWTIESFCYGIADDRREGCYVWDMATAGRRIQRGEKSIQKRVEIFTMDEVGV